MIEATAVRVYRDGTIGLYIDDFDMDARVGKTVTQLVFEERKPFTCDDGPPPIVLKVTQAQKLMDNLWDCGIRPSEGSGSAGSFAAQGRHLEDMRKLVFEGDENVKVD